MQIREMSAAPTSRVLNEQLSKTFGYSVKLEQFSDAHLEDVRNKLRTKLSQYEINEGYSAVLENHDYQKTKMFLDVINQEIFEREGREVEPHQLTIDEKYDQIENKIKYDQIKERAGKYAVPESWINSAINRMRLGESDTAELSAELKLRYDLTEADASWVLLESEEMRAEIIMASKDMIDHVTRWYEDVATMKSEQFLELTDTISELLGSDVSQRFVETVKPALETLYTTIEQVRSSLSTGLDILTGDMPEKMGDSAAPATSPTTGLEPTMGAEPSAGAAPTEVPAELTAEPESRIKRESVEYSRKLGMMLASKKNFLNQ